MSLAVRADSSAPRDLARAVWRHPVWGTAVKLALGYVLLVEVAVQIVFGRLDLGFVELGGQDAPVPRAIFLNGASIGLLYALLGMGLILIYRANRIINFAQASLGAVPAVVALLLITRKDVNYFAVLPVVVVGAALLGAAVEFFFIRRFRDAPRLIATVATIGISLILLVLELQVQTWITGRLVSSSDFTTPFTRYATTIGPLVFTGDFLVAAVVALGVVVVLGAFFRYTDIGIAVRASAEDRDRAALLGIPVHRVSTVVWVIAAVLSAIAVFLRAPMVGLSLGSTVGPSVLLYGLAAAVIARMESLPGALVAGIGIGIIDQSALFGTRRASLALATMTVVIVVALLLQRGRLARAYESATTSWQAVKEFRPVPSELRDVREVVAAKWTLVALVGFVVVILPLFVSDIWAGRATLLVIFAMVGVSLVVLTGWAGQISLGQFALAGIGAAVAGGLAANHNLDFFLTLVIGGLAGAAAAVLIGLPALRIQGLFLAVTTLAFAFTVENFILRREWFGWLLPSTDFDSVVRRPVLYGTFDVASDTRFYYLCLAFLVLVVAAVSALRRHRSGRLFIGTRDNGPVMQAYGINVTRTRLAAFALSGFIAALAGALLAYQSQGVDAATFSPERSIAIFTIAVIGGLTSIPGAILGAVYVEGLPFFFDNSDFVRLLTSGVGLLFLLLVLPGGLSEAFYRARDGFLRRVAARRGIHVPSLVADSRVEDVEAEPLDLGAFEVSARGAGAGETEIEQITCPHCGDPVPMAEAADHEHFTVDEHERALVLDTTGGARRGAGRRRARRRSEVER